MPKNKIYSINEINEFWNDSNISHFNHIISFTKPITKDLMTKSKACVIPSWDFVVFYHI